MTRKQLIKELVKTQIQINKFYEDDLSTDIQADLSETILDLLHIPPDNTVEMSEKYGDKWFEREEAFCRDTFADILLGDETDPDKTLSKIKELENAIP